MAGGIATIAARSLGGQRAGNGRDGSRRLSEDASGRFGDRGHGTPRSGGSRSARRRRLYRRVPSPPAGISRLPTPTIAGDCTGGSSVRSRRSGAGGVFRNDDQMPGVTMTTPANVNRLRQVAVSPPWLARVRAIQAALTRTREVQAAAKPPFDQEGCGVSGGQKERFDGSRCGGWQGYSAASVTALRCPPTCRNRKVPRRYLCQVVGRPIEKVSRNRLFTATSRVTKRLWLGFGPRFTQVFTKSNRELL